MSESFHITRLSTPQDIQDSTKLFEAYAESLGIDFAFQQVDTERATWPGKYAEARGGALLLARNEDGEAIGGVALRGLASGVCEMKRLYVDPRGRGLGVGRALAEAIVAEARRLGYCRMRLDTLASMSAARGLYQALGFREIEAYYDTPIAETVFLELVLDERREATAKRCLAD